MLENNDPFSHRSLSFILMLLLYIALPCFLIFTTKIHEINLKNIIQDRDMQALFVTVYLELEYEWPKETSTFIHLGFMNKLLFIKVILNL